jgi:hypothetical protein
LPLVPLINFINGGIIVPPVVPVPKGSATWRKQRKEELGLAEIAVSLIAIIRRRKQN